jgi:hypothetical protein
MELNQLACEAASCGRVGTLDYLYTEHLWEDWIVSKVACAAASNGRTGVLDWLQRVQFEDDIWTNEAAVAAAEHGVIVVAEWLYEHKRPCIMCREVAFVAAENIQQDLMHWLLERDCPWVQWKCIAAAAAELARRQMCEPPRIGMRAAWDHEFVRWLASQSSGGDEGMSDLHTASFQSSLFCLDGAMSSRGTVALHCCCDQQGCCLKWQSAVPGLKGHGLVIK